VFSESKTLSFRGEFYNAFNHTQCSGWNSSAIFNAQSQQINLAFGHANAARPPRTVQIPARFAF
jgi:hypothetical protein